MDVSRRDFTVAGALALSASGLLLSGSADAQAGDEAAVTAAVETLRKGLLEPDKAKLEQVASPQISSGGPMNHVPALIALRRVGSLA